MKPYWKIAFKNYKGEYFYGRKRYPSQAEAQAAAEKHDNWKRIDRFPREKEVAALLRRLAKGRRKSLLRLKRQLT